MKKTVLFVTAGLGLGGAEKSLCFVASSLHALGYNAHIANIKSISTEVFHKLPDEVIVHNASSNMKKGLRRIDQVAKVRRIAKNISADVVIGFTFFPNIIACIVGKLLGIKSIVSERGDPYRTIGNDILSKILLSIINSADGGVFQTDGAKKFYAPRLQTNGCVIPNPIFIPADGVPSRKPYNCKKTVVSVGRLDNFQKRYDVMLESFAKFVDRHPEYILRIIGDGPDEDKMHNWCKQLGIENKVQFLGRTSHAMRDIVDDGMFIITSDFEGISNSLLEAMAIGLPCVSTDHSPGGARFLITDHENGLLAPIQDVDKLAEAMCEFAENSRLAELCGKNAQSVTIRFSPDAIVAQWDKYVSAL